MQVDIITTEINSSRGYTAHFRLINEITGEQINGIFTDQNYGNHVARFGIERFFFEVLYTNNNNNQCLISTSVVSSNSNIIATIQVPEPHHVKYWSLYGYERIITLANLNIPYIIRKTYDQLYQHPCTYKGGHRIRGAIFYGLMVYGAVNTHRVIYDHNFPTFNLKPIDNIQTIYSPPIQYKCNLKYQ